MQPLQPPSHLTCVVHVGTTFQHDEPMTSYVPESLEFQHCTEGRSQDLVTKLACNARVVAKQWLKDHEGEEAANVKHFLACEVQDWFLSCGEMCVSNAVLPSGEMWHEPRHQDGGASVLHMGVTLYGCRTCRLEQSDGRQLRALPGTTWDGTTLVWRVASSSIQNTTVEHRTVQYSTVQESAAQNITVQYSTQQCSTGPSALNIIAQHSTVQGSIAQ